MSRSLTGLALLVTCALGCTSIVGINQPYDRDGGPVTAMPSTADVSRFVGSWETTTGTITLNCTGFEPKTLAVMQTLILTKGTRSALVASTPGCDLRSNVVGDTASIEAGQTCVTMTDGETDTFTFTGGAFVLSPDGKTGNVSLSGTVAAVLPNRTLDCTFTQSVPYTKT